MKAAVVFGAIVGVVLATVGVSVVEEPLRFLGYSTVLVIAWALLR